MRHQKAKYQLNRYTSWRKATLQSLAMSVVKHQSITTTLIKAKALRPVIERLIHDAKTDTVNNRRRAFELLRDHSLVNTLFETIAKRFKNRTGGYIRIIRMGKRRGDNAQLVVFELTELVKKEPKKIHKAKESKDESALETGETESHAAEKSETSVKEKPPSTKKPNKKFLGGLRGIFKKERDSL